MVDNRYSVDLFDGVAPSGRGEPSCYNRHFVTTSSIKSELTKRAPAAQSAKALDCVPMLDLKRQYVQIGTEVLAAVERVCASQHYILGAEVEAFERELADFCGTGDAVGCASGTDALWLALAAAGVQPGDQVLTTPFSFFASASAIARIGARPVFADIDPLTFNLDPVQAESFLRRAKRDTLRALLPVHLYGQCADMELCKSWRENSICRSSKTPHRPLARAWGNEPGKARNAGSMGVSAAFSFYPTKNLSAYGDAGLVTTNNQEMAEHMRRLRNHGSPRRYVHDELGWNSRLDALQAAILRVKLKYVEGWNEARRDHAATYDRLFVEAGLAKVSQSTNSDRQSAVYDSGPIQLPHTAATAHHVFHQYVVRAYRRDELREFLTARKIGTEVYYPIPLHLQPCFVYLGYREGDFPEAERAAKEVLALPMFPELTEPEQRWVVQSIADFYC